jgi:GntR family transcriptional regulator/MocR family aminotransferase
MLTWEMPVELDPSSRTPLFLQIARALSADIRRGRLRPGEPLPGSRSLADLLGVNRNTVVAAYRELVAEGWARSLPATGTVVSRELPDPAPKKFSRSVEVRAEVPAKVGFELHPAPPRPQGVGPAKALPMGGGTPDVRLVPLKALARAYRRALLQGGRRWNSVLDYGDARGHPKLREALARMISALRGLAASPDSLIVTRGSQGALDLVSRALIRPGDLVAVEELGYQPAWNALRLAGAELVPIPVDAGGLRTDVLREVSAAQPLRAVYVTPHHQYPSMAVLAPGRRLELLDLARRHRFAVLEDDYDHEFHYQGRPVLPLASADAAGVVVYIGSLSKLLAPGLRIGFVVAPAPLLDQLAVYRTYADRQGDLAVEAAVAELIEDGELQRHARKAREIYRGRRDALCDALAGRLGGRLHFEVPRGGLAVWARTSCDPEAWLSNALSRGIAFAPGRRYTYGGKRIPFARIGYAALDERELRAAVQTLAAAWPVSELRKRKGAA